MSYSAVKVFRTLGGATKDGAGTPASTLIGTTLDGAYRIDGLIAEGGMSAVYDGVQLRLNQRVAVKVMARELASNREALGRFRREAEIASRLRHPHLVTVMDFGTAPEGQPYLVMELLEGIDLDHRIREMGRLPLPAVVHITKQVASALAAAHDQGIVHRDLKPANVFLVALPGEPDFAKILDFGISKVRAASTQLTKASAIIGTPNYMSPEQATGMLEEIDHRTDQWALACIVWEMLSGRPPFASDDMSAVFYQIIHLAPQSLCKRAPEVPAAVEGVLLRALSKSSGDRFPSVRAFTSALEAAACEGPAEAAAQSDSCAQDTARTAAWVERRRSRQERRRTDAILSVTEEAGPPDLDVSLRPSLWRKVKPVHIVSTLAVALAVAILLPLRLNASGKPAELSRPAPSPPAAAPAPATEKRHEVPVEAPRPALPPPPATAAQADAESGAHKAGADDLPANRRATRSRPATNLRKPAKLDDDFVDPVAP